ncbi:MAG: sulfotransferase family 2 domain-containing protein [Spirochaetales bacterium]|nr:sulfotransferase family 2 domain-containing protein [Spirochaetales bacterium]
MESTLFYFHLEKTGGSSFWSSLIRASPRQDLVDDIFWRIVEPCWDCTSEKRRIKSEALYTDALVRDTLCKIKIGFHSDTRLDKRLLVHHHLPVSVLEEFTNVQVVITVRDPVERFLSEIRHQRLGGDMFFQNYDQHLPALEILSKAEYFRNYYRFWLHGFLFEDSIKTMMEISNSFNKPLASDRDLLRELRKRRVKVLVARDHAFDQKKLDAFSRNHFLGRLDCNEKKVIRTITSGNIVRNAETDRLREALSRLLKDENRLFRSLSALA